MSVHRIVFSTLRAAAVAAGLAVPAALVAQPLCVPGSWSATGRQPCMLASPGSYVPTSGAKAQTQAIAGYYVPNAGARAQIAAPVGYYVPTKGATAPTIAPPGTYVPTTGAWKATSAPVGYFAPNAGMAKPIPAGLGFFVPRDRRVDETPASPGYYVGTTAASAQSPCPTNTNAYGQAPACRFVGGLLPAVPGSIGPRFTASFAPNATIDLGTFGVGSTMTLSSWIQNGSTDLQWLLGTPSQPSNVLALTKLSLLGTTISPTPQVQTSIVGLPVGTVLGEGALQTFDISVTGRAAGAFTQTVTFETDQAANYGQPGLAFDVTFTGTVTPEPATLSLVGLGGLLVAGAAARRRRTRVA